MNSDQFSSTSTLMNLIVATNESNNRTTSMNKNTFMRYAQVIYIGVLVTFGVCGNILCAIVFSTKSLRRIRSSAYLFTLALIDVFFLLDILPGMIHTAFFSNLYRKIAIICYVQTYVSFVAAFIHIWMVLAFTAERFFAVNFPLKHMSQCTPNVARFVILIITVPAFLFYIHPAFFVSEVDQKGQCREKFGYERYLNNLNNIDTIMTMFFPFILVSVLNVLIIRKLFCSKTFRQHVFANGSRYHCRRSSNWTLNTNGNSLPIVSSTNSSQINANPTSSLLFYRSERFIRPFRAMKEKKTMSLYRTFTDSMLHQTVIDSSNTLPTNRTPVIPSTRTSKRPDSVQRHVLTESRLTKMLLAISLTCLSLNFPSYYLRFMFLYHHSDNNSTLPPPPSNKTNTNTNDIDFSFYRDVIFHYMSYLSYSINIVIYLLFGGNFRRALKRLFTSAASRSNNLNIHSRTNYLIRNEKIFANSFEFDSTGRGSLTIDTGLRADYRPLKWRDRSSLSQTQTQTRLSTDSPSKNSDSRRT